MKKLILSCVAALCLFTVEAAAESTTPATADTQKSNAAIQFAGEAFTLAHVAAGETGIVNEYIPERETLDRWTKMIAVRHHPKMKDAKVAAVSLVQALKAKNPRAPSKLWMNGKEEAVAVDFITWQGDEIAEFNIFIYRASPDGKGLVSYQYAQRAYDKEMIPFMRGLKAKRPPLVKKVLAYDFPEVAVATR